MIPNIMLRVENLKKIFGGQTLFEGLSFQLEKGEKCAFVGRNGSGKSTLFRILTGEETSDSGEVFLPTNYRLGYLKQHLDFSKATLREEAALALPSEERETPYRVESILFGLGFTEEDLSRNPLDFSGGYQLRIELARTLVQEPDCLLLDEPTNYLDVVAIRWLVRFLQAWKGEMLIISHDRLFLDAVLTHTMGLHREKLYHLKGGTREFFDTMYQIEETHEKTRQKIAKKREHAEAYIKRFGSKATKARQAQSRVKQIARLPSLEKLTTIEGLDFHFPFAPFSSKQMIRVENLSFRYPEMKEYLIQNLSFEVEPGDRIAIIGKNGRGKSTLLRLLSGALKQDSGTIIRADKLKIGFFGQTNIQALNPDATVEEEISRSNLEMSLGEVRSICGMMMFSQDQAEKKVGVLSGGEKSRVLLGKMIASACNLLLLDEPANHLDIESVEALMEALESFPGSVVVVSHSEELLMRIPEKLIVCRDQKQEVFLGGYDYFLEKIGWDEESSGMSTPKRSRKKEERRKRAELVQERSRVLSPVKKEISKVEKGIQKQENAIALKQQSLEQAAISQDNPQIAALSKEIGLLQKEIDASYQNLEELYDQMEEIE